MSNPTIRPRLLSSPLAPEGGDSVEDEPQATQDDAGPPPFDEAEEGLERRPSPSWAAPDHDWPLQPADFWQAANSLPQIERQWLPECIAGYVLDQADLRGVDASQVALNAIVALSGAMHNGIGLRPYAGEADYIERPILWGAVVGNSSVKKGAAQDIVMGRLREIDLLMRRSAALKMQERKDDAQVYEQRLAAWVRDSAKGQPAGERPMAPEPTEQDRLLVENFTMEGLRSVLEFNGRGKVFGCFDEIASLFGNLDAYSAQRGANKDAPQLLKLYESKAGMFDRAAPAPPIYIKSFAASICGGIQPGPLQRIVAKMDMTENGMLQRFMLVLSKPAQIPKRRPPDTEARNRWNALIDTLCAMKPGLDAVRYSDDAQAILDAHTQWVYEASAVGAGDGFTSAIGKFEGLFHRLALVFHAAKCADQSLQTPLGEVSEDTAIRVASFVRRFLFPHTQAFYRELETSSPLFSPMKLIAALILAQGLTTISTTHLWRYWSGWRKLDGRQRREVLLGLCEAGWLRERTKTMYAVHPDVHTLLAERATVEREKREEYARLFDEHVRSRVPGED